MHSVSKFPSTSVLILLSFSFIACAKVGLDGEAQSSSAEKAKKQASGTDLASFEYESGQFRYRVTRSAVQLMTYPPREQQQFRVEVRLGISAVGFFNPGQPAYAILERIFTRQIGFSPCSMADENCLPAAVRLELLNGTKQAIDPAKVTDWVAFDELNQAILKILEAQPAPSPDSGGSTN